jgi:XPG I-region
MDFIATRYGFHHHTSIDIVLTLQQAPGEAEAELAYLNKISAIDLVLTSDSDVFLFGATHVMRRYVTVFYYHLINNVKYKPFTAHKSFTAHRTQASETTLRCTRMRGLPGRVIKHCLVLDFYSLLLCVVVTTIRYMFLNYIFSNDWLMFNRLVFVALVGQWPWPLLLGLWQCHSITARLTFLRMISATFCRRGDSIFKMNFSMTPMELLAGHTLILQIRSHLRFLILKFSDGIHILLHLASI